MIGIGNTTIYRANGCALRLFVEACAFGTLARYDIIKLV
jgi:hypothetical protein